MENLLLRLVGADPGKKEWVFGSANGQQQVTQCVAVPEQKSEGLVKVSPDRLQPASAGLPDTFKWGNRAGLAMFTEHEDCRRSIWPADREAGCEEFMPHQRRG
jgi:hypothetical protein